MPTRFLNLAEMLPYKFPYSESLQSWKIKVTQVNVVRLWNVLAFELMNQKRKNLQSSNMEYTLQIARVTSCAISVSRVQTSEVKVTSP